MAKAGSVGEQKYLESQGVPPEVSQPAVTPTYPGQLPPPSVVPPPQQSSAVIFPPMREKGLLDTYILAIAFGFLGAHHFYLGRSGFGATYLFTFGLLGVGYVVDWFRVPCLVKEANARIEDPTTPEKKSLFDAYLLWFPFGLIGFHHFYLRRWCWGIAYLCTFGFLGIGWIIDAFRMASLVKDYNEDQQNRWPIKKKLCDAYVLTLTPISGFLGLQHYYLDRIGFGVGYTLTFGFLGIGWLVDLFRMPFLVKHRNKEITEGCTGKVRLDDAYVLVFPLGFLGLHHFYLKRYCWGFLYLCTFGVLGIGWLIDWCRLPMLVADYNKEVDRKRLLQSPEGRTGKVNHGAVITVTTTTMGPPNTQGGQAGVAPVPGFMVPGGAQVYPQQLPPYQPPYTPHAGQELQNPGYQGYPGYPGYGPQGPESYSTVTSSEGDQPPSYSQATEESMQNSMNEIQSDASAPPPLQKK